MKQFRFTEEHVIGILKQHEIGVSVADLCRKHGVSDATVYEWKAIFGAWLAWLSCYGEDMALLRGGLGQCLNLGPRRVWQIAAVPRFFVADAAFMTTAAMTLCVTCPLI